MMRRLVLAGMTCSAIACGSSQSTEPTASTVITVRVVDDRGAPVDRIPLIVTMSGTRVDARTGRDGTADVGVTASGTYTVRVVPRAGYAGDAQPIAKNVNVEANSRATVDFTVNRSGISSGDINPISW
jgi:hypothetical protein